MQFSDQRSWQKFAQDDIREETSSVIVPAAVLARRSPRGAQERVHGVGRVDRRRRRRHARQDAIAFPQRYAH